MKMTLTRLNELLPKTEQVSITDDDTHNLYELNQNLKQLDIECEILDAKKVTTICRIIRVRKALKYDFPLELREYALNVIHNAVVSRRSSPSLNSKVLQVMDDLCKENEDFKSFKVNWRFFWELAVSTATRARKTESIASAEILVTSLAKTGQFLRRVRRSLTAAEADDVVTEAMKTLEDLREQPSTEGVLQMVLCLPTEYTGYDTVLPQWIRIWNSIQHNDAWDACWLTLLHRARRFSKSFDWVSLTPLLLVKTRELLKLPGTDAVNDKRFPLSLPEPYIKMASFPASPRQTALAKSGSLLYAALMRNTILVPATPLSMTPTSLGDDAPFTRAGVQYPGFNCSGGNVFSGAVELAMFLQSLRPFFHPSNAGKYTGDLSLFIGMLVGELGRHVGTDLTKAMFEPSPAVLSSPVGRELSHPILHLPTLKYLCGLLATVSLESLFGREQGSSMAYASSLRTLVSIDPELGHVLLPVMLTALTTVNQTHQAPIALHTLSTLSRPLLYPAPVLLPYLPQLLPLVLPGLDPADSKKTVFTLSLVSSLLAWIPVKDQYAVPSEKAPPAYTTLLANTAEERALFAPLHARDRVTLRAHYTALADCLPSWIDAFMDRFIGLLDSQDGEKSHGQSQNDDSSNGQGHSHRQGDVTTPSLCECIGYLFQAIEPSSHIRVVVEAKVIAYISGRPPVGAGKTCGKLLEYMVQSRPGCLGDVLNVLLGKDMQIPVQVSVERIAFRLRLSAGAVRGVGNAAALLPHLPLVEPFTTKAYTQHTEQAVRESANKLLRDVLKGGLSVYPVGVSPVMGQGLSSVVLGAPASVNELNWYVPTPDALETLLKFLKARAEVAINDIKTLLQFNPASNGVVSAPDAGLLDTSVLPPNLASAGPNPKSEEVFAWSLVSICALLKGAAEVLGDDSGSCEQSAAFSNEGSFSSYVPVNTTRSQLLVGLSDSSRLILSTFRWEVLQFLTKVAELLDSSPAPNGNIKAIDTLRNSATARRAWMSVLQVALVKRSAWLQNPEQGRRWLSMGKRMSRTPLIRALKIHLELRFEAGETVVPSQHLKKNQIELDEKTLASLLQVSYWKHHDVSTNDQTNRAWVLQSQRQAEYASASLRSSVTRGGSADPYTLSVVALTKLSGHEYDIIRAQAVLTMQALGKRYGFSSWLREVLKPQLQSLLLPGVPFEAAAGALALLKSPDTLGRLANSWELTELLLRSVLGSHVIAAALPEQDKREKLMQAIGDIMGIYAKSFNHTPLMAGESATVLVDQALQLLSQGSDVGIRAESYGAYIVLHLLGHRDLPASIQVWRWALQTLLSVRGRPVQYLAWSCFVKLCYLAQVKGSSVADIEWLRGALFGQDFATVSEKFISSALRTTSTTIATESLFGNTSGVISSSIQQQTKCNWLSFLQGVSLCHSSLTSNEGSAQWSASVQDLLSAAVFLRLTFPRKLFCTRTDGNEYSAVFHKENAGMFCALFTILYPTNSPTPLTSAKLRSILLVSLSLTNSSEEEKRANNVTSAELTAGLYRYVSTTVGLDPVMALELEGVLASFIAEQAAKLSYDFVGDWAEAYYQGLAGGALPGAQLPIIALNGLRSVVVPGPTDSDNEGFARLDSRVLLAQALLSAEAVSSFNAQKYCISSCEATSAPYSRAVLEILSSPGANLLPPYRSTRTRVAWLVSSLSLAYPQDQLTDFAFLINTLNPHFSSLASTSTTTGTFEVEVNSNRAESSTSAVTTATSGLTSGSTKAMHALDVAINCARVALHIVSPYQTFALLLSLIPLILIGSGHPDVDTAKESHKTCLLIFGSLAPSSELLAQSVTELRRASSHSSFHVRETAVLCASVLMIRSWPLLAADVRKTLKDIFADGLVDVKPEVQLIARVGMVSYLHFKTLAEITSIAEAYTRNSDLLAARETKRRKASLAAPAQAQATVAVSTAPPAKPDKAFLSTAMMMVCVALTFPFDMPPFLPALMTSLVRHRATPLLQDLVLKTVQLFQRTHQDRWEDFKKSFSNDQIADVQGAGAAHYFS